MNTDIGNVTSGPDSGIKLYKIEMRGDSGWVKLGGIFDDPTSEERISNFQDHFMTSPNGAARSCKNEFRRIQVDKNGNPV